MNQNHPIIRSIDLIENIYKITRPNFIFREKSILEKRDYLKKYSLNKIRFYTNKKKLQHLLEEFLFDVIDSDTKILLSEMRGSSYLEKLIRVFQHTLECVYFRLDESETRLLLHYSQIATYSRNWNKFTRMSRGIVLDMNSKKIIVHPYDKFFNLNEMFETQSENLPSINYEDAEKLDGSEGIMYVDTNGKIKIITKGGFSTEQGEFATKVLYSKYGKLLNGLENQWKEVLKDYTLIFEILYSNSDRNKIVVNYGNEPDLRIIGVRDLNTGELLSYSEVIQFSKTLGFPSIKLETMSLEKMLKEKSKRQNFEGWVRRYENGLYVKVKCDEYLELHSHRFGTSEKAVWHLLREDKWDDFISNVPEDFVPTSKSIHMKLIEFIEAEHSKIKELYNEIPEISDKKEFAMYVENNIEHNYKQFMYILRSNKEIDYLKTIISWSKFRDRMNKYFSNS